jgi:hypothetical protein
MKKIGKIGKSEQAEIGKSPQSIMCTAVTSSEAGTFARPIFVMIPT